MQSLIIGELSYDEKSAFDKVLYVGLGRVVDITSSNEPVAEVTDSFKCCESIWHAAREDRTYIKFKRGKDHNT